jgi:hypothetical protein
MINWTLLIVGLISFAIGLIGLNGKSHIREYKKKSLTGVEFMWSSYFLLGVGVVLVVWSFFSDEQ